MNERQFRQKITWVTFLASLLVVWVHSVNWELFLGPEGEGSLVAVIERTLAERVGQIAVPCFFMVSAYLFFRNFSWEMLVRKWKSRVRSLLVPYLIWNVLYYFAYLFAAKIGERTGILDVQTVPLDAATLVRALFFYAYNPVFWYLYQLILLTILAPLVYVLMKHRLTAALTIACLFVLIRENVFLPQINADALFYYCVGAFCAITGRFGREKTSLAVLFAAGVAAWLLGREGGILWNNPLAIVLERFFGAGLLWVAVSICPLPAPPKLAKDNFFLYAIHFVVVRLANKVAAFFFEGNAVAASVIFLILPSIALFANAVLTGVLSRIAPGIYRLLSGGRGK